MIAKITVNDRVVDFDRISITYDEVVALADMPGPECHVMFTSRRDGVICRTGSMHAASTPVLITDVMTFRVSHTGNA